MSDVKVYVIDDGDTFEGTAAELDDTFLIGNLTDEALFEWCKHQDMHLEIQELTYEEWDQRTGNLLEELTVKESGPNYTGLKVAHIVKHRMPAIYDKIYAFLFFFCNSVSYCLSGSKIVHDRDYAHRQPPRRTHTHIDWRKQAEKPEDK